MDGVGWWHSQGSVTGSLLLSEDICAFGAGYPLEAPILPAVLHTHTYLLGSSFFPSRPHAHSLSWQQPRSNLSQFNCKDLSTVSYSRHGFLRSCPDPRLVSSKSPVAVSFKQRGYLREQVVAPFTNLSASVLATDISESALILGIYSASRSLIQTICTALNNL